MADSKNETVQVTEETDNTAKKELPVDEAESSDIDEEANRKKKCKKAQKGSKSNKASRKKHWGDRKDGYRIRSINVMNKFMPYVMPMRCDACNTFADELDITRAENFIRNQVKNGNVNFSILHVLIAAYIRAVAKYPAINRFVSGQKIYARNDLQVVMTIKKKMSLSSPDTCIKVWFEPSDTILDIYNKFNATVEENKQSEDSESSFDKLNKVLCYIPGILLRWTVKLLSAMDYWGLLPKKLTDLSPFHGSMIITSMGSLGIKPIYHHLYNFGNLPVFFSYGIKRTIHIKEPDGNRITKKFIDLKVVTDERICDGYYYASAFKYMKKLVENPELLLDPPTEIIPDID